MRFKTSIFDAAPIIYQAAAINPLGCRVCLKMTEEQWTFIMNEELVTFDVLAWATVSVQDCFDNYRIESREEENAIFMEVEIQHLVKAFKSLSNAVTAELKLMKCGDQAYLRFELFDDEECEQCKLRHDVPILIRNSESECFEKPRVNPPELKLVLNDVRNLKNIVDRLAKIDNVFTIEANAQGNLRLSLEKDGMLKIETRFKCAPDREAEEQHPDGLSKSVRVRARAFQKLLSGLSNVRAKQNSIWLCFVEEGTLVVHCALENTEQTVTYFVNIEVDNQEEEEEDLHF